MENHPKNQLDKVICQIRFPALLSIDRDIASFQESISKEYPMFILQPNVQGVADIPVAKNYIFNSPDGSWSVSISVATVSLTTSRYDDWKNFSTKMKQILDKFTECFDVKDTTRIGLRYINAIRPSSLGCNTGSLDDLIQDKYIQQTRSDIGKVQGFNVITDLIIDESTNCRSVYGTIQFADQTEEQGFLIDNDVYSTRIEKLSDTMRILNDFNEISKSIFCELTTEKLQRSVGL